MNFIICRKWCRGEYSMCVIMGFPRWTQCTKRLLHERPVILHAVANSVRDWLGSLADQHVVGSWGGAGADAEQRIERGMPCPAPVEAEHELVEVVLEVGPA